MAIQKLGILSGNGALPQQLAEHCRTRNIPYFILAFSESASSEWYTTHPHAVVGLGSIGTGVTLLKEAGVSELVMAGHLKRPSLRSLQLDEHAKRLLKALGMKLLGGDDALLRALITFLEQEGFRVLAAHEILGGITASKGCLTKAQPSSEQQQGIQKAMAALVHLSPLDVGQSLVIEEGSILGVEAAEGTDGLIERCGHYQRAARQAVLVKAKKTGQDERADMPTIGPQTIHQLHAGGYAGLAIQAQHVLIIDREEVVSLADQYSLFVTVVEHG